MKIKSLNIKNFKSIVDVTINEPNLFTVFVGPNGSGKSNIFEALKFFNLAKNENVENLFGGKNSFLNFNVSEDQFRIEFQFSYDNLNYFILRTWLFDTFRTDKQFTRRSFGCNVGTKKSDEMFEEMNSGTKKQLENFHRLFVNNLDFNELKVISDIKNILLDENKRIDFIEWLKLFVPEFENIEVSKSPTGDEEIKVFEKFSNIPFNKKLISDGTYNIIALLTAVYQSDEPQFLCIEEPENGLHPFVIRKLVDFFRQACEDKGHYIWLNTHSQTLVECLTAEEVIVVDKVEGETRISQLKGTNLHGLDMAEYWLSGATGGGTPW